MIERKKKKCKSCGTLQYIFGHGLCYPCYNGRVVKVNDQDKKKFIEISRFSKNQRKRLKRYEGLRENYLRDNPVCEVCKSKQSQEIHHKAGRVGNNLFSYFLAVCQECHRLIEENPVWAKENNYSINRIT